MEVQIEEASTFIRKLSVTIPSMEVDTAFENALREVSKKAQIPGFRPGKAPKGLLRARYGEQIQEDVQNQLVESSLPKVITDHELAPVSRPNVHPAKCKEGVNFSYVAEVEIQPEITLTKYEGLEVEEVPVIVEEKDIEAELTRLQTENTQIVPVEGRDVAEEGDTVVLDYEGLIGGVPFDGGKAEDASVEVGAGSYLAGFEAGIKGKKVPSEIEFPVDFPEDYQAPNLAGQTATFKAVLKELKTKEKPALDDDFAQDLGEDNLEDLRLKISEEIKGRKEKSVRREERNQALAALVESNPFDCAPSIIDDQANRMIYEAAQRMAQYTGVQPNFGSQELESLKKDSLPNAENHVRSGLLLLEVTKVAGMAVEDADIDTEIEKLAEEAGANGAQVKTHYRRPQERDMLKSRLLEDKVIDYLLEKAIRVEPKPKEEVETTGEEPEVTEA
ncbi:MAG: trigger factor [Myxococcota bacterium]|nr:trigger factor [Myxococcota bacterium]